MRPLLPALLLGATVVLPGPLAHAQTFTDRTSLLVNPALISGVAMGVVDLDGDGKDDILRVDSATDVEIEYQQAPNAAFTRLDYGDLTLTGGEEWSLCVADCNQDGFNDIVIGGFGIVTKLLLSDGMGDFTDSFLPSSTVDIQGSNFADIDNDGIADVFLCNDTGPNLNFRGTSTPDWFLYDLSLVPTPAVSTPQSGDEDESGNYASIWTDFDNDGDIDLYISKCRSGVIDDADARRLNTLWENDGSGNYTEVGLAAGMRDGEQTWCTAFGDIDNDGDFDAFVVNHFSSSSRLMENNGDGTFTEITVAAGFTVPDLAFFGIQADFTDFDNDGFVDLLVSATVGTDVDPSIDHRLFRNNGNKTFTLLADPFDTTPSTGSPTRIHSFALGDLNADGYVDVSAGYGYQFNEVSASKINRLWMNDGGSNHHFSLRGAGTTSNPSAIGARVEIHGAWGMQVREVRSGEGYGVMHSLTQYFGLGAATRVDRAVVRWPSGIIDEVFFPPIDQAQALVVTEGSFPNPLSAWLTANPGVSALDADDDNDTMDGVLEYALQRDPLSGIGADGKLALPTTDTADTGSGERLRLHCDLPEPPPANVIYRIEANSAELDPDSWLTIAIKTGASAWSGPASVTLGTPAAGRVDVIVEDTVLLGTGDLRCLRLTAQLVALPES